MIMQKEYGKLPKEFKEKLLNALRGGMYKKCNGMLRRKTKGANSSNAPYAFCVLGVVADIAGAKFDKEVGGANLRDVTGGKIPEKLKNDYNLQSELIKMNDSGKSFKKLADWIEEKL